MPHTEALNVFKPMNKNLLLWLLVTTVFWVLISIAGVKGFLNSYLFIMGSLLMLLIFMRFIVVTPEKYQNKLHLAFAYSFVATLVAAAVPAILFIISCMVGVCPVA